MYGIYANIGGILMGSMLPHIAAPWILWDMGWSYYQYGFIDIPTWTILATCQGFEAAGVFG